MKRQGILQYLKKRAKEIKKDLIVLHVAFSENLVPWNVKLLILFTLAYALSPIDLIPDFIPVLGLLDDLIVLPLLIVWAIKLIPETTLAYCRKKAEFTEFSAKKNWIAAGVIITIWIAIVLFIVHRLSR